MLRLRSFVLAFVVFVVAAPALAQTPNPFSGSLEEAAKKFDPTKGPAPTPSTPPAAPTAPTAPSASPTVAPPPPSTGEPAQVDGWTVVSVLSDRRGTDGKVTTDACGYERDVVVERTFDDGPRTSRAVLVVPCTRGDVGLVAGKPSLRLPAGASGAAPPVAASPAAAPPASGVSPVDKDDGLVEVSVAGALNKDAVVVALRARTAAVVACRAGGAPGRLAVRLEVGASGATTTLSAIEGSLKGTAVEACVVGALKGITFSRTADGKPASINALWGFAARGEAKAAPKTAAAPPCKPGEKPRAPAQLKPGEVACVEPASATPDAPPAAMGHGEPAVAKTGKPAGPRPCAEREEPKAADELGPDEVPCKKMNSERGVAFLKGELSRLGDVQLVNARSSFGVGLGVNTIDTTLYGVLRPDVNVRFGTFQLGLGAPLRFEVLDWGSVDLFGNPVNDAFGNFGRFRTQDWDQVEDWLRPIRYITYGKKEDRLYVNLNRVNSTTIGHGQLVRRYTPNLDIDEDNLFANFDAYGDWGGVELMGGPFPAPRLVGGLAFVKPLGIAQDVLPLAEEGSWLHTALDSWSIGFTYVADLNSPTGLEGRFNPGDQRRQLAVDDANQFVWRNQRNPIGDVVQGLGIDTEVKVLKLDNIDIKTYADFSALFFPADSSSADAYESFSGSGATVGALVRVSLGEKPIRPMEEEEEAVQLGKKPRPKKAAHALRLRLEGRSFSSTYLPSYWNTMYEVDRFQFGAAPNRAALPTKVGFLAGQQGGPMRAGYYAEVSYAWVDALALTAMYEDASPLGDAAVLRARNLALHAETAGLGWLQLFATYHYRNFEAGELGKAFSLETDNELLFVGARLQVLPVMFLNFAVQRAFRLGFSDDDASGQVDRNGYRYSSLGLANTWTNGFDVELGWQF